MGPSCVECREVPVQMNFGDQEMHYGAPYLCRSDPHAAKGATSIPSRNIRVRRLADANHFQGALAILQGFFPILAPLDDLHDWSRCIDALADSAMQIIQMVARAARRRDNSERAFCGTEVVLDDLSGGVAFRLRGDCGGLRRQAPARPAKWEKS
jgi:hypothetical protein